MPSELAISKRKRSATEHEPRKSRRVQGFPPLACVPLPYLPLELCLLILGHCEKRDLKRVRLVSKDWCSLVTRSLFDTIYISPHEKDVEVFKCMSGHPVISGLVRKLVYDTTSFETGMTYKTYWRELVSEFMYIACRWRDKPFKCPDQQFTALIKQYKKARDTNMEWQQHMRELRKGHMYDSFVIEGYEKYVENASYERRALRDGKFHTALRMGLSQPNGLCEVCIRGVEWSDTLNDPLMPNNLTFDGPNAGSPLARSWSLHHLRPTMSHDEEEKSRHTRSHFELLIPALAETNRLVTSFTVNVDTLGTGGLPALTLTGSPMARMIHYQMMVAFWRLETFDISILKTQEDESSSTDLLNTLPILLWHMPHLKSLRLDMSENSQDTTEHTTERWRYEEIFPAIGLSSQYLTDLLLSGLSVKAIDLYWLIGRQQHMRVLMLSYIDLSVGSWEALTFVLGTKTLEFCALFGELTHKGGTCFASYRPEHLPEAQDLLPDLEKYMIGNGPHPCLPKDGRFETALQWFLEIFPSGPVDDAKKIVQALIK